MSGNWTTVPGPEGVTVSVRLEHGDDGRRVVTGLHLEGAITADILRSLRLARIEAAANGEGCQRQPLRRPGGTDPDTFYAEVADAYRAAAAITQAPATLLAREASVPVSAVYRWVREARRRGFLPVGRKGKAG
ncbi:hypothetical protein AB0I81_23085 [Nonomuraea sp. NPDC050404]|uniref:hypothetical protein n=1 Tax=Nonomuraea sp. NPDC050404 TaxID=3155783 RepID=UPI0033D8E1C0